MVRSDLAARVACNITFASRLMSESENADIIVVMRHKDNSSMMKSTPASDSCAQWERAQTEQKEMALSAKTRCTLHTTTANTTRKLPPTAANRMRSKVLSVPHLFKKKQHLHEHCQDVHLDVTARATNTHERKYDVPTVTPIVAQPNISCAQHIVIRTSPHPIDTQFHNTINEKGRTQEDEEHTQHPTSSIFDGRHDLVNLLVHLIALCALSQPVP